MAASLARMAPDTEPIVENEFGTKNTIAGVPVFIAKPPASKTPVGLTFVLTAANIPLSKYMSIRNALLSQDHIVVGYMINALNPPRRNHRTKAENVQAIFAELKEELKVGKFGLGLQGKIEKYDIVGHSVGGKIALLVAALHNDDHSLRSVVALDPVDQRPVEFTNTGMGATNLSLKDCHVTITMTYTDCGVYVSKDHNGRAIHKYNPATKLINHRNAGHMCYCDEEGRVSWKSIMNAVDSGNPERGRVAKEEALAIIKDKTRTSAGKAVRSIKKEMSSTFKEMVEGAEDAAKSGKRMFAMSSVFKGMT